MAGYDMLSGWGDMPIAAPTAAAEMTSRSAGISFVHPPYIYLDGVAVLDGVKRHVIRYYGDADKSSYIRARRRSAKFRPIQSAACIRRMPQRRSCEERQRRNVLR